MESIIEKRFKHEGLECVILFTTMGHRCGYVGVPEEHVLFNKDYSDDLESPELLNELKEAEFGKRGVIPLLCWDGEKTSPEMLFNVHGGITFAGLSDKEKPYPIKSDNPTWFFGFDCAHYGDGKDWVSMEKYYKKEEYEQIFQIDMRFHHDEPIRTLEYVETECKNLAEQIKCVETAF